MNIGLNGRYLGPNKTGVGRYLINILEQWGMHATQHTFFVYTHTNQLEERDKKLFKNYPNIIQRTLPLTTLTRNYHFWYAYTLPRLVSQDHIDFFFSPDYFLPYFFSPILSSMTIHDVSYLDHPEWYSMRDRIYYFFYSKKRMKKANALFTISEFTKNRIKEHISNVQDKIYVTPLAADNILIEKTTNGSALKKIGISGKYFLYVGKIFTRRHVPEMLNAFYEYCKQTNDKGTQFVICGENSTLPIVDIQKLVHKINASLKRLAIIHLINITDESLSSLYKNTQAFFYLSNYEGFGLPIVEALTYELPIVTAGAEAIKEVVGNAALFVDPSNINDITKTISLLLTNTKKTEELRAQSLQRAKEFSWNITAGKTMQVIEKTYANR